MIDKDKGSEFSSLIIGTKEKEEYKYIGLLETAVDKKSLHEILKKGIATDKSIFSPAPNVNKNSPFRKRIKNAEVIWLEPNIQCKVKYLELDKYGMMRHASFQGLIAA